MAATVSPAAPPPITSNALVRLSWDSQRRTQRTGWKNHPVADTASAVHHQGSNGPFAAPGSESRHPSRSKPPPAARAASAPAARSRATIAGAYRANSSGSSPTSAERWRGGIDAYGTGECNAIATTEHDWPSASRRQNLRDGNRRRCLAGAAERQVADTKNGNAGRAVPAAPSAIRRPRHTRRPAATTGRPSGPADATRTMAHALSALPALSSRIPRRSRLNCIK